MLPSRSLPRPGFTGRRDSAPRRATLGRPDFLTLAVGATFLLSVGRLQEMVPVLKLLRPALLLMLVSIAYLVLRPGVARGAAALGAWPSRVVLGIVALAVVGAPFGLSAGATVLFFSTSFLPVVLFWALMVLALRRPTDLSTLIWGYMLGAALLCINALFFLELAAAYGSATMRLEGTEGGMFDANDMCVVLVIAMPFCILQFQSSRSRLAKIGSLLLLGAIAQTIALSGSRGGFVGLIGIGSVLLVMAKNISVLARLSVVGVATVALFVAAPDGYWEQMSTVFQPKNDYNFTSSSGRIAIWKRGMGYMVDRPAFGVGLSNFNKAECSISSMVTQPDAEEPNICAAPHNSYVQAGAELGVPGLVLWVSLVFGSILAPLRLRRRLPAAWNDGDAEERFLYRVTMYLPIAAIGFAITAFFVSHAWNDMIYALAAWTAGLLICVRRKKWQNAQERVAQAQAAQAQAAQARTSSLSPRGITARPWPPR